MKILNIKIIFMKNSINNLSTIYFLFIVGILLVTSCHKDNNDNNPISKETKLYSADVALSWTNLLLEIDRYSPGYRPPAASRMMAYIGLAAYEAAVPGMSEYQTLSNKYYELILPKVDNTFEYHWPTAVNAAYASIFKAFYPHINNSDLNKINQLEFKYNKEYASQSSKDVIERSVKFGKEVAEAVFKYSKSDTYGHEAFLNPFPSEYKPPKTGFNGEKLWQPTIPDFTPALFPYWGKVRPFGLSQSELRAKPPIPYSEDPNSKFYLQAAETRLAVNKLGFEDKWIAEFWSDDFFELTFEPAARQLAIANQLIIRDNISLDRALECYAKLGMSMCDAAIAIWNSKYIFNVRRPVEYIRDIMEPNWLTALNNPLSGARGITPPFPAYPSGHSGFGGSGATILTDIFGDNRTFTDNCHLNRFEFTGNPRTFQSFYEAGTENAYSRIPLGVHYRMDCDEGLRLGYLAAKRVIELPWKK